MTDPRERRGPRWSWDDLPEKAHMGAIFQNLTGDRMTLARFRLPKGLRTKPSSHPQEQFTYIISGRLRYRLGEEEVTVREGEVLHVAPNLVHHAEVLEDSVLLDIFAPAWPDLPKRRPRNIHKASRRK